MKRIINIGIIGSYNFFNKDFVEREFLNFLKREFSICISKNSQNKNIKIITGGGGEGVEWIAEHILMPKFNTDIEVVYPEWDSVYHPEAIIKINKIGKEYNFNAPLLQMEMIIALSDYVLLFFYDRDKKLPILIDKCKDFNVLYKKINLKGVHNAEISVRS